ncbi:hypothetical protein DFH08DRAFT_1043028 [Mycena albidolilacea]|uniref:F-box domain-containing protein n=1 Tax=Mycena albidolilacea TaxID=1033008 RepID=A0AAD7F023_9AGAR|nr:hypothetical protein DFH08DRAFT_1043028 [Mycena albidolilacea]
MERSASSCNLGTMLLVHPTLGAAETEKTDVSSVDEYDTLDFLASAFGASSLKEILTNCAGTSGPYSVHQDPKAVIDTYLLRNHHAKLAARIDVINTSLQTIDNKRIALQTRGAAWDTILIAKLDKETASLQRELAVLSYTITPHAFHNSPIRWVPDDILAEIFVAATSGEPDRVGRGIGWLVTQVCASWRNVACALPCLWSTFTINLLRRPTQTDLLRITLERCRAAALTVVVTDISNPTAGVPREIEMLADHAENIVNLELRGTRVVLIPLFIDFRDRLLRLETLVLGLSDSAYALGHAFEHTPRLHTLELARSTDLLDLKYRLPLTQIHRIQVNASTSGHHLGSLQNLTSMVSIQTALSPPVGVLHDPPALRSLATWRVEFAALIGHINPPPSHPPSSAVNFFARFRTPALRTLHIRRLTSVEGVIQLFRVSQCELRSLVLEDPLLTADDLLRLLADTPSLQSLEIFAGGPEVLDDTFLNALSIRCGLLPCLAELRLDGSSDFNPDSLREMLENRASDPHMRLRKVEITLRDRVVTAADTV